MAMPLARLLRLSSGVVRRGHWGSIFLSCSHPSDPLWIDAVGLPVPQCHCACGAFFQAAFTARAAVSGLAALAVLAAAVGGFLSGCGGGFTAGGAGIF